jgi:hypothetical protein
MPMLWRIQVLDFEMWKEYIWAQQSYNKICDKSKCLKDDEKEVRNSMDLRRH